jgi:hypothetical protein
LVPTEYSVTSFVRGLTTPNDDYYIAKADDSHYGFLELAFSADGSSLLGTFYANDVDEDSKLDQFTISK